MEAVPSSPQPRTILTVSDLARSARLLLEEQFNRVYVEGEISNLSRPRSGHWYFSLKDNNAQISCAMFANRNRAVKFEVENGQQIRLRGRVTLYEARGNFQIIVDALEPAGEGALQAAFDALKKKLQAEGLFDSAIKKTLPEYPKHIVVISSATGAALQDILSVFKRRYPSLQVTILPVAVQGSESEKQVLRALGKLESIQPDVAIIARGGGSIEDLWTFNLESVARAINDASMPVISAIGHETDFTIADFVADIRAPTPTAAAEIAVPNSAELINLLEEIENRLTRGFRFQLSSLLQQVNTLKVRLIHPGRVIELHMQKLDELDRRLSTNMRQAQLDKVHQLRVFNEALKHLNPKQTLADAKAALDVQLSQLKTSWRTQQTRLTTQVTSLERALSALSPVHTLERGYAIVSRPGKTAWGTPISSVNQVNSGEKLTTHLKDGSFEVEVIDQHD